LIDGLWGTGKSLLAPIVSGMNKVEKVKIEGIYEYVSWLFYLEKINKDAALWMLRTYADISQYHNVIGREVNLRWNDDSGLKYASNKLQIIRRIFGGEGDCFAKEIDRENIAFCPMTHMLMLTPELLAAAYGKRLKIVEMVRHPLYMITNYKTYFERFDSPREGTISFTHNNTKVPWFARGWKDEFVQANYTERAVLCVTRLYPWLNEKIETSKKEGLDVLDLSFEEAVFETDKTLDKLMQFTGRNHHPNIKRILKKQMLPRDTIAKGRGHVSYGWVKNDQSEEEMYSDLMMMVKDNCSIELQRNLHNSVGWYDEKYPSKLAELAF